MANLTQAYADFACHLIQQRTLRKVISVKQELGIEAKSDVEHYHSHKYEGPTFISGYSMHGVYFPELSDGEFVEQFIVNQDALEPTTLQDVMRQYSADRIRELWLSKMASRELENYDSYVQVLYVHDNLRHIVACADIPAVGEVIWMPSCSKSEAELLFQRSEELEQSLGKALRLDDRDSATLFANAARLKRVQSSIGFHQSRLAE